MDVGSSGPSPPPAPRSAACRVQLSDCRGSSYHFKRARVNAIPRRSQRFTRQRVPLGISERNASARPAGCALSSHLLRTYLLDYHSMKLVVEFGKKKVWLSPLDSAVAIHQAGGRTHKREQAALGRVARFPVLHP